MHCSLCHHWVKGVYPLKMTATYTMLKTRRITLTPHAPSHTHTPPAAINHVEAGEWKEGSRGKHEHRCVEVSRRVSLCGCVCAFTHLLSRQQIHSADGAEFGDVCTATIFPGRVTVRAAKLPEDASRLSVVVNECELRLRPLPAPLLRAASHNYRLMLLLLLLPSSWHADDLCQGALMGFL